MNKPRILVVDDESSIRHVLGRLLEIHECETRIAGSCEEAEQLVEDWEPLVAMLDIVLPGKSGIQFLSELKQRWPDCEVLIMTSNSSAETALQAIRRGAHDYIEKPFSSLPDVWANLQRALEKRNLRLKNRAVIAEHDERTRELSDAVALPGDGIGSEDFAALSEILENFMDVVIQEMDVTCASLMLRDKNGYLHIPVSRGIPDLDAHKIQIPLGAGIAGRVAQTGEPYIVDYASADRGNTGDDGGHVLANSFIVAPIEFSVAIKTERECFGSINVAGRRSGKPFHSDDVTHMSSLAEQLAAAIENVKQSDQLRKAYESLKTTQEQLVFTERVKAVGQMAAGVAHDFNNALSVILARAQFAINKLGDPDRVDDVRKDLETIIKTSLQGAEAIRRIQDYTRARKDTPKTNVDINAVIRDAVEIARPKWKEQSELAGTQIDAHLDLGQVPEVHGNVYELTQVVNNLIFNAVEAMPEGGELRLRSFLDQGQVAMEVEDTGTGIDEDTRARLFEPFFTTKETGNGLGTSIIAGIVTRHDGQISVDSEVGRGSTFRISLPRVEATPQAEAVVEVQAPAVSVRVLLVDDEEMVRETHVEALTVGGHEVVGAAGGEQALELCRQQEFDIVITDLSMVGMSGLELAEELKKLRPELPIILFSGWAPGELESRAGRDHIDHVLSKPCMLQDLLGIVQKTTQKTVTGR